MLFLTYWFVLFAAVVYPLYWLVRHPAARRVLLLVSCAVFHTHFAGPAGVLPIIALAVLTYLAGLTRHRAACYGVAGVSAVALVFYKYTRFLCAGLVGALLPGMKTSLLAGCDAVLPGAPPLAISFFVFEFIHYLVEVGRGAAPVRNVIDFSLYAIFWPSIVAGPVKRYQEFLPALCRGVGGVGSQDVAVGMTRVAVGIAKKVVADNLTAALAYYAPRYEGLDLLWRWFFVACISLRILWDFSGYSDMAIGFARMHGIRLAENFNWPYLAGNVTDFWRRWHISLSQWIRDYVYIALGGGRVGVGRKVVNGLVAFGICGLWHGAGWNFLVWGLYHGAGLAISANYRTLFGRAGRALGARFDRYPGVAWLLTLVFVGVGWLFFFYPLHQAWRMVRLLFQVYP